MTIGADDVIELTKKLVNINSESNKELKVAQFIEKYLESLNIDCELMQFQEGRANVIAQIGKGEGLMMNGHIDTVPVGEKSAWKYGVDASEHDGKLYGRGTSDMKGAIACMLVALSRLNLKKTKRRLLLTFVAGEETGFDGSNYLLDNHKKLFEGVKFGVIGEATDMKIQIAQKGATDIRVSFKGKAAHGSKPHLGNSAILMASRFINEYLKYAETFTVEDKFLGKGTVNVGTIKGGTAVNVVPDSCEIAIDRRVVPGETPQMALDQVKDLLKKMKIDAEAQLIVGRNAFKLDEKSKIIQIVKKASGSETTMIGSTGYTEAELYKAKANIDSVVFGPGTKEIIHQANEYVDVDYLKRATDVYEKIIREWCL
ncbi:MAG: M20 family metallopeptidase [Candidatus Micrarchaeales archaeon]